jgi:phospholipase/carboxylesterase
VNRQYAIDRDRLVLTGFSQGGFVVLALGMRHPDAFAGVIPMAGPYIPEIDAPAPSREESPKYYFMAGARDQAASDMRRAAKDYESAGYEVKLRVIPNTGHSYPDDSDRELTGALRWVLKR